ncbi:mCG1028112, isoform CRA_a [Mus musculus]|nr:mCG1028112, isoform CRA_a [Mus musculus]
MSLVGSFLDPTFPQEGHLIAHAFPSRTLPYLCCELLCPNPQAPSFKRCLTDLHRWNQEVQMPRMPDSMPQPRSNTLEV